MNRVSEQQIPPHAQPGPYGSPHGGGPYADAYGAPYGGSYGGPYGPRPVAGPPVEILASQGIRLAARAVDVALLLLCMIAAVVLAALVQSLIGTDPGVSVVFAVVCYAALFLGYFAYEPLMTWRYGATVGKLLCGIRVARLSDGRNLTFGQSLGRYFVNIPMGFVPFLGLLNVLWCCWDQPYRQCLHDKVVSSVVVKQPRHPR